MGKKRRKPAKASLTFALNELPTELIERILDEADLPRRTLFDLATSCGRRLQPILLARYIRLNGGGLNPQDKCVAQLVGRRRDDLIAALNLASFIKSIRHFECRFPRGNLEHRVLLKHFERVERLLGRLEGVEVVIFDFHPGQLTLKSGEVATRPQDAKEWCERLGTLLDAVLLKGCRSLEIRGLRHYTRVYHLTDSLPALSTLMLSSTRMSQHDRTSVSNLKAVDTGKPVAVSLSNAAKLHSKLTHLIIASENMVSPCLIQWTSSVLTTSAVTHLTVQGLEMTRERWIALGDALACCSPTVKNLRLGLEYIDPEHTHNMLKAMGSPESLILVFRHHQDFSYADIVITEVEMSRIHQVLQNLRVCEPPVVPDDTAVTGAQLGAFTALRIELEMEIPQPSVVEWMLRTAQRLQYDSRIKSWTSIITDLTLLAQYPLLGETGTTLTEADQYLKIWFTKIFPNVRRIVWKACADDDGERVKDSLKKLLEWELFRGYLDKMDRVEVNGRAVKGAAL